MKKSLLTLTLACILMLVCVVPALADVNLQGYPITDETISLKLVIAEANTANTHTDMWALVRLQEETGVRLEVERVDNSVWNERKSLMFASNELPDLIIGSFTTDERSLYFTSGQLTSMNDMLPLMPNYSEFLKRFQPIERAKLYDAQGNMIGFIGQASEGKKALPGARVVINQKWLDAVEMKMPTNWDELVAVLTAFRDKDPNGNGENDEITTIASANNMHNYFYGSFGLRTRGAHHDVVDVDPETGELRVYFQHENFRKYVEFMTMMYQEKLIYQEIFTEGDKQSDVFNQTNRLSMLLNTIAPGNGGDNWYTVNWSLEGPDGYAFHTQTRGAIHSTGNFVITCDCPEELIPVALKWVDYFYSEEGSALALIGVEGEDWEVKEDGTRSWTDAALATRTEDMSNDAFRAQFGMWPGGGVPACFFSNLLDAEYGPIPSACAQALLKDYAPKKIWPIITFTADESAVVSQLGSDINNFAKNFAAQVMTGEKELTDDTWAAFQDELAKMNPEKLIDAYESALTRVYGEGAEF